MIKVHVFDVDGTILDSMRMWNSVPELFLKSIGIEPPEDLADTLDPMTVQDGETYLAEHFNIPGGREAVTRGIWAEVERQYREVLLPFDDILEEMDELKENGEKMVVFSNTPHIYLDIGLERNNLTHYFDEIFTVDEVGIRKDYKESFEKLAKMLDVDPSEMLVYEDSGYAIDAARNAGCEVKVYDRYR